MSPRPGGEAAKLGDHYEGAWIALQILEVLAGRAESLTVEELGEIGEGVEFTLRRVTVTEVHQVKRQRGSANYWNLSDLRREGVLDAARQHVAQGREFHFVSTIPAQWLQDLAERARHSPYLHTFVSTLTDAGTSQNFGYLSETVYESQQVAWDTLRGTWARWPGEREVRNWNSALAGLLVAGAPAPTAAATLADLARVGLSNRLDRQGIADRLGEYGLSLVEIAESRPLAQAIRELAEGWRHSIERELLRPPIHRPETDEMLRHLLGPDRYIFAIGLGGVGKSAVLYDTVEWAALEGWVVLPVRLDRLEQFSLTHELGEQLGLGLSPVSALARVAGDRPSLLVVDQLDAVSKASGRMPQTFDAVADLVREAGAFPEMRMLLGCRQFDHDNDDRIRTLIQDSRANGVVVGQLSDEQVLTSVQAMGIALDQLTKQQLDLLRLPLHLKLLTTIADQVTAFSFNTTRELFDAYWDRKRRDCRERRGGPVRFGEVVAAVADEMSARQRLTIPVAALDDLDLADDAEVLASEHVLVRDRQQIAFFHETFFDYAFARHWTRRGQTLVEFLLASEQELFRRAQVRQILTYIREEDPERFVAELRGLLAEPQVRYHIKHVALGVLRALPAPTQAEWQMVEQLLEQDVPIAEQLWLATRVVPWFDRLDAEGVLAAWLASDDELRIRRALEVMLAGARERPDQLAALLAPHANQTAGYPAWLRWVAARADLHTSRALFDLVAAAVCRGDYDGHVVELFLPVHDLGNHQPEWAVELLVAYLVTRPEALTIDGSGQVSALLIRDFGAIGLVAAASTGAPASFSEQLVPYLLDVMRLTAYKPSKRRTFDRHFMHRFLGIPHQQLDQALLAGAATALGSYIQRYPDDARPLLDRLVADPHDAAQSLLYEALIAAGAAHAEYSAGVLLDGDGGLEAMQSWTERRLIQAISTDLADETFARLEQAVVDFRPDWDSQSPGHGSFTLLSAMDEARLSEGGRRRLGELRRRFGVDQPEDPGIPVGGFIGSPIPKEAAQHMTDAQWLGAIATYNDDREDWKSLTGGARELAHTLKEEVKKEPGRFSRLALRFGEATHGAYPEAILMGLGESDAAVDPTLVFQAVRYLVRFGGESDRWLGFALSRHLTADLPDDIILLLVGRAIQHSSDPEDSLAWDSSNIGRADPIRAAGLNHARAQLVETLGNILVYDADGHRTALIIPTLNQFASDPSLVVRGCAAHLIAACLRHARAEAIAAFELLIQADDQLLATHLVGRLLIYIGNAEVGRVIPVIERMLSSEIPRVREAGGGLAAYAGLELGSDELMNVAQSSVDIATRKGLAQTCAGRLPFTANAARAGEVVRRLINDPDEEIRKAVAGFVATLRDMPLRPFAGEVAALIQSPSFTLVILQVLQTLNRAPDRIDDLVFQCVKRYIEIHGVALDDIASPGARDVGELLLRAYAQVSSVAGRSEILDLLDLLLQSGAYGVPELVDATER